MDLEDRVPAQHPLGLIRCIVNEVLGALSAEFARIYSDLGRPFDPARNRNGLIVQAEVTQASGRAEREMAKQMIVRHSPGARRITVGADKGYHTHGRGGQGLPYARLRG